jgi:aldehyde dehydrogenase family protein
MSTPFPIFFRVKDEDEAIALANDSDFGLGGYVFTRDEARGQRVASRVETGMMFINNMSWSDADLPFGGIKDSGYGRELGDMGIQPKAIYSMYFTLTTAAVMAPPLTRLYSEGRVTMPSTRTAWPASNCRASCRATMTFPLLSARLNAMEMVSSHELMNFAFGLNVAQAGPVVHAIATSVRNELRRTFIADQPGDSLLARASSRTGKQSRPRPPSRGEALHRSRTSRASRPCGRWPGQSRVASTYARWIARRSGWRQ